MFSDDCWCGSVHDIQILVNAFIQGNFWNQIGSVFTVNARSPGIFSSEIFYLLLPVFFFA